MSAGIQGKVLAATIMCMRPLARILLRSGINYRQFSEAAKIAFLEEAGRERDSRGRVANVSRVAVRTGLSRKEVARVRDRRLLERESVAELVGEIQHAGHAARTLQLWFSDPRFVELGGEPRELGFAGEGTTFTVLVRMAGGDVPPGAVRAELLAAGSVVETPSGTLKAIRRHFVPGNIDEDLVVGLTQIVHPVIEGLARNTIDRSTEPFLQRLAYSDRLIPAAVPLFRQVSRDKCESFIHAVDDWLSANEISADTPADELRRVGVGVFYFEGLAPVGFGLTEVDLDRPE